MLRLWRRMVLITILLALLTGCDQATKRIATGELKSSPPRSYAGDLIRVQYSENQGAFLSMGAELPPRTRTLLFTVLTGLLLLGMLLLVLHNGRLRLLAWGGLVLYLGGGLGNLIDRVLNRGAVVDFLNLGLGPLRTGIFNLADVFIMVGAIGLLVAGLRSSYYKTYA